MNNNFTKLFNFLNSQYQIPHGELFTAPAPNQNVDLIGNVLDNQEDKFEEDILQKYRSSPETYANLSSPSSNYPQSNISQSGISTLPEQKDYDKENYNPYRGAQAAVDFAQSSLDISKNQRENAFNKSLLAFGDRIGQEPVRRGFKNNLVSILKSFAPAIEAYNTSEEESLKENRNLLDKIRAYQRQEMLDKQLLENQQWQRDFAEKKFAFEKQAALARLFANQTQDFQNFQAPEEYQNAVPMDDKTAKEYSHNQSALHFGLEKIKSIEKSIEEIEEISENNLFAPIGGPLSHQANAGKDFFAKFSDNSNLAKEVRLRKDIEAELGKLNTQLESQLKNQGSAGTLGQGMYDRLSKFFPNPKDHDLIFIKDKLKDLRKEAQEKKKMIDESLKYRRMINPEMLMSNQMQDTGDEIPNLFDEIIPGVKLIEDNE